MKGGLPVDWKAIKTEYITGDISYRKLAEKYGAPFGTLRQKAKKEQWCEQRAQYRHNTDTKTIKKTSDKESSARANTVKLFDKACNLLLKRAIALAENELSSQEMRQLSATLKDLKELKGLKCDADMREQEARIKKLEAEVQADNKDTKVTVEIVGDLENWSK
jgi:hypothetical protein